MFKDYYLILGISYPSTPEEIKAAFRRQAKRWHPDHNPGMDTTSKMQDIVEAYSILKNEESRRLYNYEYEQFLKKNASKDAHASTDGYYAEYDFMNQNIKEDVENARNKAKDRNYWDELLMGLKNNANTAIKGAWNEMKYYLVIILIFTIIGFIILLCSNCSTNTAQSQFSQEQSETTIAEAPIIKLPVQEIPKEWKCYQVYDAFELSVPPTVELRNEYDSYTKMLNDILNISSENVVFQQKELSKLSKDAYGKYCRIICQYVSGEIGDFLKANEAEPIDEELIQVIHEMVGAELAPGMTIMGDIDIDWVSNGSVNAIRAKYLRTGANGRGPVQCQIFLLFNNSEAVKVILSYRQSEYDIWNDDFEKVIYSFNWKTKK